MGNGHQERLSHHCGKPEEMCVGHATERQREPGTQRDIPATWPREAAMATSVTGRGTDTTRKRRVVTAEGERWNGKLCK